MDEFNPMYDDGYFKCLLDIKKFLEDSDKQSIRSLKQYKTYTKSFIDLLLSDANSRSKFRWNQELEIKCDANWKVSKSS